jgi:hypothetical protein
MVEGKLPMFSFISKRMTPSFSRWNSFYFHDVTPELSTESWHFIKPEKTANCNHNASDGEDLTQIKIISEIHYPLNMKSEHSTLVLTHPIHSIWYNLTWFHFCTMVRDIPLNFLAKLQQDMVYQHQMIWKVLSIKFREDQYVSLFRLWAAPNTNSQEFKKQ